MAVTFEDIKNANKLIQNMELETKKGMKEYAPVNERIKAFRSIYPQGYISTEMISNENGMCIFRAYVGYEDESGGSHSLATGTAYEKEGATFINKTSYIENCETSAVGRALGMAGFGIDTSLASAEEVANAILNQDAETKKTVKKGTAKAKPVFTGGFMDEAKLKDLLELAQALGYSENKLVIATENKYKKKPTDLTEEEYHDIVQIMTGKIADGKAE